MNPIELYTLSETALTKVVDQIQDDQWELPVPKELSDGDNNGSPWTVRTMINYHAYDDAWVPDVLAGKTPAEVGTKYDGDLLGENPKSNWLEITHKGIAAAKDADLQKTVHLTYGDYPASEFLYHITLFRTLRTVDFARFLGFDETLPDDLAQGMFEWVEQNAQMLRSYNIIGDEISVPNDASFQDRLMGITGRRPRR